MEAPGYLVIDGQAKSMPTKQTDACLHGVAGIDGSNHASDTSVERSPSEPESESWDSLQQLQKKSPKTEDRVIDDVGKPSTTRSVISEKWVLDADTLDSDLRQGLEATDHLYVPTRSEWGQQASAGSVTCFKEHADSQACGPAPKRKVSSQGTTGTTHVFDWREQPVPPETQRGFGQYIIPPHIPQPKNIIRPFPPLPNYAYNLTPHCNTPGEDAALSPPLDGVAFVKKYIAHLDSEEAEAAELAHEEDLRCKMTEDFTKRISKFATIRFGEAHFPFEGDFITSTEQQETFAADVRKAAAEAEAGEPCEPPLSHCRICGESHIPWGPPHTLQQSDTCLSKLPEWFPAEKYDEPWLQFNRLINEIVRIDEIEQGLIKDQAEESLWDKEYHENTAEWRALGRRGGWWKCRTGREPGEEEVPLAEILCSMCHQQELKERPQGLANAKKKENAMAWIRERMAEVAARDREIVLARMKDERETAERLNSLEGGQSQTAEQ